MHPSHGCSAIQYARSIFSIAVFYAFGCFIIIIFFFWRTTYKGFVDFLFSLLFLLGLHTSPSREESDDTAGDDTSWEFLRIPAFCFVYDWVFVLTHIAHHYRRVLFSTSFMIGLSLHL